ncbi:hypothetical protein M422DRAFT_30119 [Sphaerobolus stellatus SS14]|uniref:D-serine dehydratase n=1 Tax=Sphaerobolus stellatus (strain SS14) TaxID=990650 RepID=A0A0C9UQQ9_SPHS4|nr:hypothetical protein M422DRAFT_30119 [Sphaerobolus stellatus SS14]
MTLCPQTSTPYLFANLPSKATLVYEFKGKTLNTLRTPAMLIDRAVFSKNCALMHETAKAWGAAFRAHIKSHKTVDGIRLQLVSSANKTTAIVVSTVMEAWEVIRTGLVADGTVKDMLYGLPVGVNKIADLAALSDSLALHAGMFRILVDSPAQVQALETYNLERDRRTPWSVFVKVECGGKRAGLSPDSSAFKALLLALLGTPAVSIYGFYCHAGQSYASTSVEEASKFLSDELQAVNMAAKLAQGLLNATHLESNHHQPFVLSIGSTPTAHAFGNPTDSVLYQLKSELYGKLELHAGNYPMLDLQQVHTGMVGPDRVSHKILTTVLSYYPKRGADGSDEAICDAGALALSKDTGPSGGFGDVVSDNGKGWYVGRVSQEHGILVQRPSSDSGDATPTQARELKEGEILQIIPQHACLTAACYPWFYVIDSDVEGGSNVVIDVWVPWKGW